MSWGNVYPGFTIQTLYLSNTNPIYDDRDRLVGMTSVDFTLEHINSFLKNFKIGRSGQGFTIDRQGNLIATSTNEMPFVVEEEKIKRVSPQDSNNILVRATEEYLQQEAIDLSKIREPRSFSFQLEGKRQLIRLTPFSNDIFQALEKHLEIDFIYEEPCISKENHSSFKLSPEDIDILPKMWLKKFQQAIVEGRMQKIETLVREIPLQNQTIATALLDLVSRYEFESILDLIQKTDNLL